MRCVDLSLLVYAHRRESPDHDAYRRWLDGALRPDEALSRRPGLNPRRDRARGRSRCPGWKNGWMAKLGASDVVAGVWVVEPAVHGDERGVFVETYRREWFPQGLEMVQANRGDRRQGAVVGLHYHLHQADYWYVPFGSARVVLHDLRQGSPTDGATLTLDLGARPGGEHDHRGVFIPPGVAHGFAALSDMTITYLVDRYHNPADELGVAWDDPEIDADWGLADPILSARDQANPRRADLPADRRPHARLRP